MKMSDYEPPDPYPDDLEPDLLGGELIGFPSPRELGRAMRGRRQRGRCAMDGVEQEVPTDEELVWSGYVAAVSALDVLSGGIVSVVGLCFAIRSNSVSLVSLSIQTVAHLLSSVLLIVRFVGESQLRRAEDAAGLLKEHRRLYLGREHFFSKCMGLLMLCSSGVLVYKASEKIAHWNTWYEDHSRLDAETQRVTEGLAWYGFAFYLLQAVFRRQAALKLRRQVLWHSFWASVVALLFLLVLGISASYQKEWSWRAEPFAAIVLAMATLIEGMRMLILHFEDIDDKLKFDSRA